MVKTVLTTSIQPSRTTSLFEGPGGQKLVLDTAKTIPLYSKDGVVFYPLMVTASYEEKRNNYKIHYIDPYTTIEGIIWRIGDQVWSDGVIFKEIPLITQIDIVPLDAIRKIELLSQVFDNRYILISRNPNREKGSFRLFIGPHTSMSKIPIEEVRLEENSIYITTFHQDVLFFSEGSQATWNGLDLKQLNQTDYQIIESAHRVEIFMKKS